MMRIDDALTQHVSKSEIEDFRREFGDTNRFLSKVIATNAKRRLAIQAEICEKYSCKFKFESFTDVEVLIVSSEQGFDPYDMLDALKRADKRWLLGKQYPEYHTYYFNKEN